nr:3-oxoacyl-ACP synthase [uncultured Pedobacter sp.]
MKSFDLSALKIDLFNVCLDALTTKGLEMKTEVEQLRIGIANDSKSSMGDKYETSREMMQQEINRLEQQIALNAQQIFTLKAINIDKTFTSVEKGSLVETNIGIFFISVSYGEIKTDQYSCFMISEFAPLAKLLLKKKVADTFELNNKSVQILNVY